MSPDWRQMAIENTVSSDFNTCWSIVKSVFDCRLSGVFTVSLENVSLLYKITITVENREFEVHGTRDFI